MGYRLFVLPCLVCALGASALAGIVVPDSSFENVTPTAYPYYSNGPGFSSPSWVFPIQDWQGVDPSSGVWFVPPPPDGTQAAFLQQDNSFFWQTIAGFTVGESYEVSFYLAQRPGYGANGVKVSLGGIDLGTYTPSSTAFDLVTTAIMTASASSMTLRFEGTNPVVVGDTASAIDLVSIQQVPEPGTAALLASISTVLW
jgi:hypothetical protein